MKTTATVIVTPGKPNSAPSARKLRQSINSDGPSKLHRHPWENRKSLSEEYEPEMSGREGWWRTYIRETPVPGAYQLESQHWLYDLERRPNTYRFKSDGRKVDPHPYGKGALLLPGAYESYDFLKRFERDPTSYGFKTGRRDQFDVLNFGRKDKDVNVSPDAYDMQKYLTMTIEKQSSRHSMFKSQAKRFPTIQFKPKEGPAPGSYESDNPGSTKIIVSSSFKSKTPRFSSSHTDRLEDLSNGSVRYLTEGDIFHIVDGTFIVKYLVEVYRVI